MKLPNHFSLHFAPQTWTFARKFLAFAGPPFNADSELITGTAAVVAHREKYELLAGIANELVEKMEADAKELEETGHTSGRHGKALAALAETMFGELYSILDGLRRSTYSIYRGVRGVQNKSTLTFFQRAAKGHYGSEFPASFSPRLREAYTSWFPKLRMLRTETTHGETGTCWPDKEKQTIRYWHGASTGGRKELHIDNVVPYLNETYKHVVTLEEFFFENWFNSLLPIETRYVCGVYLGRMYERMVAPSPTLSFGDGRCWSRVWFETEPGYLCPLREKCAAYNSPVSAAERDAYFQRTTRGPE